MKLRIFIMFAAFTLSKFCNYFSYKYNLRKIPIDDALICWECDGGRCDGVDDNGQEAQCTDGPNVRCSFERHEHFGISDVWRRCTVQVNLPPDYCFYQNGDVNFAKYQLFYATNFKVSFRCFATVVQTTVMEMKIAIVGEKRDTPISIKQLCKPRQ